MKQIKFFALFLVAASLTALAQTSGDDLLGVWFNEAKDAKIRIYKCGDGAKKYCGKLIWLKKDKEDDGGERIDKNNPDASKRKTPMMNLVILKLLKYDASDKEWNGGTIYDPKSGKTYSCYIKKEGNLLKLRGYVGVSVLGKTSTWTLAE